MTDKTPIARLLDSALMIAFATAVCYVLGFLAHMRTGWALGIPWHLLPDLPLQQTLVIGGIYLLMYLAVALFLYFLYLLLEPRVARIQVVRRYFENRFTNHRIGFSIFIAVIGSTILLAVPLYFDISSWGRGILQTKNPPKVIELNTRNNAAPEDPTSWQFISRKDGLIILKNKCTKRFTLINEDDIVLKKKTHNRF